MGYSQHGSREVKSPFSNFPRAQSREKQKKEEKKSSRGFLSAFFLSFLLSSFLSFLSLPLSRRFVHLATTATRRPLSAVNPSSTFSEKFSIKKVAAQSGPIRLEA